MSNTYFLYFFEKEIVEIETEYSQAELRKQYGLDSMRKMH